MEHDNWPNLEQVLGDSPNPLWLQQEIERQANLGRLLSVTVDFPKIVHPIGVKTTFKLDGSFKFRQLDYARLCNAFQASMSHKYETVDILASLVQPEDLLFGIDLTDFYYQIPLHPLSQPYTCFKVKDKYWSSRVLLVSMKPATFWVVKINRPILLFFRHLGLKCSNYIVDWFGAAHKTKCDKSRLFMMKVLELLGFKINFQKSSAICTEQHTHLGIVVDATAQKCHIHPKKKTNFANLVDVVKADHEKNNCTLLSNIRKLSGIAASFSIPFKNLKLWMRILHKFLDPFASPTALVTLPQMCLDDITDAAVLVLSHNGTLFSDMFPDSTMMVDAGEVGHGGHVTSSLPLSKSSFCFPFTEKEIGRSSTFRELFSASCLFTLIAPELENTTLELKMDSKCSIFLLTKAGGSISLSNNFLVRSFFQTASKYNISLVFTWVERESNIEDRLSKIWAAMHLDSLCPTIPPLLNLSFPSTPFRLIQFGTLRHFLSNRRNSPRSLPPLVLIHPVWEAQPWWPILVSLRKQSVEIGVFAAVFPTLSSDISRQSSQPSWRFQATLL
jgi:hypothetical protein